MREAAGLPLSFIINKRLLNHRFATSEITIWGYLMQKHKKKHKKLRFNTK